MSQIASSLPGPLSHDHAASVRNFAGVTLALAASAAFLAGWLPLGFSIVTVFLFAGPHNWIELRYFMARMPGRWGKLRGFFLFGFGGIFALAGAFMVLSWFVQTGQLDYETWLTASALWNTALVVWIVVLVQMRSRQNPRRDWFWTLPVAFGLIALTWLWPQPWGLALVYLHPIMAFWILDRELRRSRPEWRGAYHKCLACVPLLLGALWWHLADAPNLPGVDMLAWQITEHAGASILQDVSNHLLVATHTFLEMLHYSVWLVAIPLVGLQSTPWKLQTVPMARRSPAWRRLLLGMLAVGVLLVLVLWAGFLADYPTTRDVYFTVAILHVLAEVPFLLRAL